MSTETLIIEGRLIHVDYDIFAEESPSLYSPGSPEIICINRVKLDSETGDDAMPFIMAIDDETKDLALGWVERLLNRKLQLKAEDQREG